MEVSSIKSSVFKNNGLRLTGKGNLSKVAQNNSSKSVSFGANLNLTKKFWFHFTNLSDYMKEASEMTNAVIAMIGTGLIAPFAIMCSPKKKCAHPQGEKQDKEKKFFQAIRQPISAFLAFAFQVPTTVGILKGFNYLAHKKHVEFFNDEILGTLIPEKKYLRAQAKKALKDSASPELKKEWADELKLVENQAQIKAELKEELRKRYADFNIPISEEKLDSLASSKGRIRNFVAKKMADAKNEKLISEKVQELSTKTIRFDNLDFVTEDYQNSAKLHFKKEFDALNEKAKLNIFDKFIKLMGFSNKKIKALDDAEKALAKERGLELLKKDMGDSFCNEMAKLRKFVETRSAKAQKLFGNKIFWLSLVTNLFMVGISCVALNWMHPKFAAFIDKIKGKKNTDTSSPETKVEVKA